MLFAGARDGTCKERSDGIAIAAHSADRVSHGEKVTSAKRKSRDTSRDFGARDGTCSALAMIADAYGLGIT